MNRYFVYILTSNNKRALYIGVTNNIIRRLYEHKNGLVDGFSKKYNTHNLIYLEESGCIEDALQREKQLKRWSRKKKEDLINSINPDWNDLSVGEM